jgi:hypothetical protein
MPADQLEAGLPSEETSFVSISGTESQSAVADEGHHLARRGIDDDVDNAGACLDA